MNFSSPTEIQEKAIPYVISGKDVVASAATGSGKTFAFSAGIIDKISDSSKPEKGIKALVLVPTRELAEQVSVEMKKFSKYKPIKIKAIYGGVSFPEQVHALNEVNVVVGTPGRVLDHINKRTLNTKKIKTLVLDEADRMLDMGFIEDVREIIKTLPKRNERQTLLFSATIGREIESIVKHEMNSPVEVGAEAYVDERKLHQVYYDVPQEMKFSLLVHLLKEEKEKLVMVFCNTRRNTDFIARHLNRLGINALAIHGGFSQNRRTETLGKFMDKKLSVLICTDVAARGLDVKEITHVYNYDIPNDSKDYIHRVGRTARAGEEGIAVSLVCQRDYDNFRRVINQNNLEIKEEKLPQIERIFLPSSQGRMGRREGGFRGRDSGRSYGGRGGREFGRTSSRRGGYSGGGRSPRGGTFGRGRAFRGRDFRGRSDRGDRGRSSSRERSFGRR
jgi:ATP-dependent RNA helicase DeaD